MSGLENYQVSIVRGKRRRQQNSGCLTEAARVGGHERRGKMPSADRALENWGPRLHYGPESSAAPRDTGQKSSTHISQSRMHTHTHIMEQHGPGQKHSSYTLCHPLNKCSQSTYYVPASVWALALVSNPPPHSGRLETCGGHVWVVTIICGDAVGTE